MKCIVTVETFENPVYNFLIPSISSTMEDVVNRLATLEEPNINISRLNTIYIVEDYKKELLSFQEAIGHDTFVTENKIATGFAQVVHVTETDQATENILGYHS